MRPFLFLTEIVLTKHTKIPAFLPEPDWLPYVSPYPDTGPGFVSNVPGSESLRSKYFQKADLSLVGKAWFGSLAKGPPGHAHGGSQAALLDDAMGTVAWMQNIPVLAVNINIDFKKMLPLNLEVLVEAIIEKREGRKVFVVSRIFDESGAEFAIGKGLFLELKPEQMRSMISNISS